MDDQSEQPKEQIPISSGTQEPAGDDWTDNLGSLGFLFAGLFIICFCGGFAMYGDYGGPPEGLANSNRLRYIQLVVTSLPGIALVGYGIWRLAKTAKRPKG